MSRSFVRLWLTGGFWLSVAGALLPGLVLAQAGQPTETAPRALLAAPVIQPSRDHRQYRYLTLPNHMEVLLISDTSLRTDSVALNIAAGSNQDPQVGAGTAGLLAFSLLPGDSSLPGFVAAAGGEFDTRIEPEATRFSLQVPSGADALNDALGKLAQLLAAPVFSDTAVARGLAEADLLFQAALGNESSRRFDVYCSLFNPEHPMARACDAQNRIEQQSAAVVREQLEAYYQRYYSARLMTLAVSANASLDELERQVSRRFGALAGPEVELAASYPPLFAVDGLPRSVDIRTGASAPQLRLSFPVALDSGNYAEQPLAVVTSLLENAGLGSLTTLLRDLGWAESVRAGFAFRNRHDGLYEIDITLTDLGIKARDQVVALVFYLLEQVRDRGVKEWRYSELSQLAEITFRFTEQLPGADDVRALAEAMAIYRPEDVLYGPYKFNPFDEKTSQRYLAALKSSNVLISFSGAGIETDALSSLLAAPFLARAVSAEQPDIKIAVRRRLSFPEPNTFIPKRLTVKETQLLPGPAVKTGTEVPTLVVDKPEMRAWYLKDSTFQVPKAAVFARIESPAAAANAVAAASNRLFARLLQMELAESVYPATVAGFTLKVSSHRLGLGLALTGYSSQQGLILTRAGQLMADSRFDQHRFDQARMLLIKQLEQESLLPEAPLAVLHLAPAWPLADEIAALRQLEIESFLAFTRNYFNGASVEALFYGNFYRQEAQRLAVLAEHYFTSGAVKPRPARSISLWPAGQQEGTPEVWPLPAAANVAAALYIQGPDREARDLASMAVIGSLLPRQEQELAYRTDMHVGMTARWQPLNLEGYPGFVLTLESTAADAGSLQSAINWLLARPLADTPTLAQAIARAESPVPDEAASLIERGYQLWHLIEVFDADFGLPARVKRALDTLTPEALEAYYTQVFQRPARRLWLQPVGQDGDIPKDEDGGSGVKGDSLESYQKGRMAMPLR